MASRSLKRRSRRALGRKIISFNYAELLFGNDLRKKIWNYEGDLHFLYDNIVRGKSEYEINLAILRIINYNAFIIIYLITMSYINI